MPIPYEELAKGVGHDMANLIHRVVRGEVDWASMGVAERESLTRQTALDAMRGVESILEPSVLSDK